MKYFENALNFLGRFFVLIIPIYLLYAIPSLINGIGTSVNYGKYLDFARSLSMNPMQLQNPSEIMRLFSGLFITVIGASLLGLILEFITKPASFGMINNALKYGSSDLNEFVPALKENFIRYVIYWIGSLLLWLVFSIAACLAILIFVLLAAVIGKIGYVLVALVVLTVILAGIALGTLTSLWFPAMVAEELDVLEGLKKSFKVAGESFWTILGLTLLVWLIGAVAGFVLGFFGIIPVIGSLVVSMVPAVTGFFMMAVYMMIYREKASGAK